MNEQSTATRIAAATAVGLAIALSLIIFWRVSADESWSSDAWLICAVIGIILSGPSALLALLVAKSCGWK